jgi:hypothetical protein
LRCAIERGAKERAAADAGIAPLSHAPQARKCRADYPRQTADPSVVRKTFLGTPGRDGLPRDDTKSRAAYNFAHDTRDYSRKAM